MLPDKSNNKNNQPKIDIDSDFLRECLSNISKSAKSTSEENLFLVKENNKLKKGRKKQKNIFIKLTIFFIFTTIFTTITFIKLLDTQSVLIAYQSQETIQHNLPLPPIKEVKKKPQLVLKVVKKPFKNVLEVNKRLEEVTVALNERFGVNKVLEMGINTRSGEYSNIKKPIDNQVFSSKDKLIFELIEGSNKGYLIEVVNNTDTETPILKAKLFATLNKSELSLKDFKKGLYYFFVHTKGNLPYIGKFIVK